MGNSSYSTSDRIYRATTDGYYTKSADQIFTQSKERKMHESMNPKGIQFRESCDSAAHPNTVPIILALDVTGSMGHIPHDLIKDGLPTLMSNLIEKGTPDASLLFLAVGDHESDRCPLQVGQFESGDKELDMWLTRTYLEGGGGGNGGESYALAWYFAANHTKLDCWKRHQKGFLFTVGDEPLLQNYPISAIKEIMGNTAVGQSTYNAAELLDNVRKTYNVYHIHVDHGWSLDNKWKELLGDNLIEVNDYKTIPNVISKIVNEFKTPTSTNINTNIKEEEML